MCGGSINIFSPSAHGINEDQPAFSGGLDSEYVSAENLRNYSASRKAFKSVSSESCPRVRWYAHASVFFLDILSHRMSVLAISC